MQTFAHTHVYISSGNSAKVFFVSNRLLHWITSCFRWKALLLWKLMWLLGLVVRTQCCVQSCVQSSVQSSFIIQTYNYSAEPLSIFHVNDGGRYINACNRAEYTHKLMTYRPLRKGWEEQDDSWRSAPTDPTRCLTRQRSNFLQDRINASRLVPVRLPDFRKDPEKVQRSTTRPEGSISSRGEVRDGTRGARIGLDVQTCSIQTKRSVMNVKTFRKLVGPKFVQVCTDFSSGSALLTTNVQLLILRWSINREGFYG